uniref:Uncharacterized protein n=1 Tax=Gasterosteus aculeatus TaxID=69293 RepID=G3Q737_GASAC
LYGFFFADDFDNAHYQVFFGLLQPVCYLIGHSILRVVLCDLIPALDVHFRHGAQSFFRWPLPFGISSCPFLTVTALHVILQLGVQHAHLSPIIRLSLQLPLLLHYLTGQDKVIRLHTSAGHTHFPLHAKYAQLGSNGILTLLLDHGAPNVVHLAASLRGGDGHADRLGLAGAGGPLGDARYFLPLSSPKSRLLVRRVGVAVAGLHRPTGGAVGGGRMLGSGSVMEGLAAKSWRNLGSNWSRGGSHLGVRAGNLPIFKITFH